MNQMSTVRNTQIAKIKIAKKDLGMDDETYRDMLELVTGKRSAADLDFSQRNAVLHHLEIKLGWKPKRKKVGPKKRRVTSQADKIRALWIELHELGIVRDKSESALMTYVRRMTNGKYAAPQFCDAATASRMIETLKKWKHRELKKREQEEANRV